MPRPRLAPLLGLLLSLLPLLLAEAWLRRREAVVMWTWDEGGTLYRTAPGRFGTNSLGFHERELPTGPDPGQRRVLVLGDSMTWGTGTSEQAWPREVERALGAPWQLWNLSTYGYDLDQSVATLRRFGPALGAELLLYAAYVNDLHPSRVLQLGEPALPVWIGPSQAPWLQRRSALARAVEGGLRARGLDPRPDWTAWQRGLEALVAEADGRSLGVLALAPQALAGRSVEACEDDAPGRDCAQALAIQQEQVRRARALGLPVLDLHAALGGMGGPWFPPGSQDWEHPSVEGQAVMAGPIAAWITQTWPD